LKPWRYTYSGRGYLRFAELAVDVSLSSSSCAVHISRGGPSRVEVVLEGHGKVDQTELDELAERIRGHVVVFSQAAIQDFHLGAVETIGDSGEPRRSVYARTLRGSVAGASVCVPFEHQTDMNAGDVETLAHILTTSAPICTELVASIEHSLTRAEGDVEAFLANYAVLESVLVGGQSGVDAFLLRVEPGAEMTQDSRGKAVTMYTKLRNAKGHPTDMPPAEASTRIRKLLPKLRGHVRTALLEASQGDREALPVEPADGADAP